MTDPDSQTTQVWGVSLFDLNLNKKQTSRIIYLNCNKKKIQILRYYFYYSLVKAAETWTHVKEKRY